MYIYKHYLPNKFNKILFLTIKYKFNKLIRSSELGLVGIYIG